MLLQCSNYSMVPGPSSEHMHYLSTSSYTNRSDDSDYFQLWVNKKLFTLLKFSGILLTNLEEYDKSSVELFDLLVTAPTHYMLRGSAHFGWDCTVYACMVCSKTLVTGMNNKHAGLQSNVHITSMTYVITLRIHFCATLSHHQICVCFLYS